jgi:hypothetical protein
MAVKEKTMALAAKAKKYNNPPAPDRLIVQVTPSGNYVAGGDTLNLTKITDPDGVGILGFNQLPLCVQIVGENAGGYRGEWVTGTTRANGKVKFYTPATGATDEVAAGAYPAGITGGVWFAIIDLIKGDE